MTYVCLKINPSINKNSLMRKLLARDFDAASESITAVQQQQRTQRSTQGVFDLDVSQQFLDEASLFIKRVPRVRLR